MLQGAQTGLQAAIEAILAGGALTACKLVLLQKVIFLVIAAMMADLGIFIGAMFAGLPGLWMTFMLGLFPGLAIGWLVLADPEDDLDGIRPYRDPRDPADDERFRRPNGMLMESRC